MCVCVCAVNSRLQSLCLRGICRFKWINHTDSARHATMEIFGSCFVKQNSFFFLLTVNTEKKPQNKTVERITIDPHLSHAQSHLNGRLFLPEEPAQTFKSTANARFSPLPLFLSLLKTAMLQLNAIPAQAGRLGGAIEARLHTRSFRLPLCCRHSPARPLQSLLCRSPNPGTKCVCPTSWSLDAKVWDHHTTHSSGRWHFLTPEPPLPTPGLP